MRTKVTVAVLALVFGLAAPACLAAATAADLQWLAGCWALRGGEPGTVEQWLAPAGGTLLGVSRIVKGGKTVEYEFLRIRETDGGQLEIVAQPSGQASATFGLLRLSPDEVVFENAEHDFPQRIVYRRDGGALLARIEGTEGGKAREVEFPMDPVACPAAGAPQRFSSRPRVDRFRLVF